MKKLTTIIAAALMITAAFTSCLSDKDNGSNKVLMAQIGMLKTNGEAKIPGATLDDGSELIFSPVAQADWATTKDSIYRAMIYFYIESDKLSQYQQTHIYYAEPAALQKVLYMKVQSEEEAKDWINDKDAIEYVSGMRANGYINMQINVPTGNTTANKSHTFGVAKIGSSTRNQTLRLCHNQNDIPKAYNAEIFASIPVRDLCPTSDTITVIIPTSKGDKTVKFVDASLQANTNTNTSNNKVN